jgi:UDP-N-acetylmuramoyl-L-alanyl-D-glutamate--2,6-diaminopimelate ligase
MMDASISGPGGREVSLEDVLPGARFVACSGMRTARCSDDAEACGRGDVFVARVTPRGDGHDRVARALARGAAGVVAERFVPTAGVPLCLVPDSNWAFARLRHAIAGDPSHALKVIAVAGTVGKTTTSWLAAAVLAEAGLRVGVISDLGCLDADATAAECCDHERPEVLAAWLERFAVRRCRLAIVETTDRMLAAHALAGVACDTVAITNVVAPRSARMATQRLRRRALDALRPGGCLIAGTRGLDRLLDHAAAHESDRTCLTVGRAGDVTARRLDRGLGGQAFLLAAAGQSVPVTVDTPVPSFARDAAVAAAIGMRYGVPLHVAARGIEAAGAVAGRVERLDRGQDFAAFLDRAGSRPGVEATLGALRRLTGGRLAVVAEARAIADQGGRSAGRRIAARCDELVVVPAGMMDETVGPGGLAAYARIDRLLDGLGRDDCLLVLGGRPRRRGQDGDGHDIAAVVDGWLRLAHPFRGLAPAGHRAA